MTFLLKAMGFGETITGFSFTALSDANATVLDAAVVPWTLKAGKSDEDGKPVTIFSVALSSCSTAEAKSFARNALTLSKRLRLPDVLRCYGGTEYNDTVYIATEPCEPLSTVLTNSARRAEYYGCGEEEPKQADPAAPPSSSSPPSVSGGATAKALFEEGVAMGLKSVGSALNALHRNDLFHGNVCADSVFVTESGFWRLSGLELASPCVSASTFAQVAPRFLPPCRVPRRALELLSSGGNPRMMDSFGLGCLIYESLVLTQPNAPHDFASRRNAQLQDVRQGKLLLPQSLQAAFHSLVETNPRTQHTVTQFMAGCDFINESEYVLSVVQLEELALWDQSRRDRFMEQLAKDIPKFPRKACVTLFLAKVMESLRMGTASASVVAPVVAIAKRVTSEEDFNVRIIPALVALYGSPDRVTRYRLLQQVDAYGPRIASKPLNEQIWPLYMKGFTSPAANIREFTARGLVALAPRLSAHAMTNDVPRMLQGLQQDPDGTIRTNATICLCLVADYIPDTNQQRAKILVVGFGRMLKDTFLPSRMAALNSLNATLHQVPVKLMADMVVPGVAPVTMDAEAEVRQAAFAILKKCLAALEDHHERTKATASADAAPPSHQQQPQPQQQGWTLGGVWTSAAAGTPTTPSPHSSAMSTSSPKHLHSDPMHLRSGGDGSRVGGLTGRSAQASAPTPLPSSKQAAPSGAGASGWSDDDADDWPSQPTPASTATASTKPVGKAVPAAASHTTALLPSVTTTATTTTAPHTHAHSPSGGGRWSDDEDDEDGWGGGPTPAPVTRPAPLAPRATGGSAGVTTLPAASLGMSLSSGGAAGPQQQKPAVTRRKAGGLGASRMD